MNRIFSITVLTVVVASSYITLGIAAPAKAESWWAIYGAVTFVLAVANLLCRR